MVRILLSFAAALAACTPSPEETTMRSPSRDPGMTEGSNAAGSSGRASLNANRTGRGAEDRGRAAQGPIPEPVSAAENPVPAEGPADSPAEAEGRRTLSTAFVMVGPEGRLAVELRDGRVLVLRDVVMRRKDYCGVLVSGGKAGARHCGGYADVAAARPGASPSRT
jgi:hypothetical protein